MMSSHPSSSLAGTGDYSLILNIEPEKIEGEGIHYRDLPEGIREYFLQKSFSNELKSKSFSCSHLLNSPKQIKIMALGSFYVGVCFLGIAGAGLFAGYKLQSEKMKIPGYFFLVVSTLCISYALCTKLLYNFRKRRFVERNDNGIIPMKLIKHYFNRIPKDLIYKLDCAQFSKALKYNPQEVDDLKNQNMLSETQNYLLIKIPFMKRATYKSLVRAYFNWDLFAEVTLHPIFAEALKYNLPKSLRANPEIQTMITCLEKKDATRLPPPPIEDESKSTNGYKMLCLEGPIPEKLLYGRMMYYLENVDKLRIRSSLENRIDGWVMESNGVFINGELLYPKIIYSLSTSLYYSDNPIDVLENIKCFLLTFGIRRFSKDIYEMTVERFSRDLYDNPSPRELERLLKLIPIVEEKDSDHYITLFKKVVDNLLLDKEVLVKCWDTANRSNLVNLKGYLVEFCRKNQSLTKEAWLAVPRELRYTPVVDVDES